MLFNKPQDINKSFIVNYASIFSSLGPLEKKIILQKSEVVHYSKGKFIYKQGDPPDAFYCVITGRIKIFKAHEHREEVFEFLTCGMYFGVISLLTSHPHSANAEAVNDSLILKIKKEDFDFLIKRIPNLAIDLSKTLSQRLRTRDYVAKVIKSNIIAVYSAIKGIGRTMYAINLAISLRKETNKKVIFLDITHSKRTILKVLNIPDERGPIDLKYSVLHKDVISRLITRGQNHGVDFLNIASDNSENNLAEKISPLLTLLTNDYQYIIVDLPLGKNEFIFKALTQSDAIHLITDYEHKNLKYTRELMLDLFKTVAYPQDKIKIILNEKKEANKIPKSEVISILEHEIFANIPVFWEAASVIDEESAKVILLHPESEYAKAVRRISRHIGDVLVGLALGGGAAFGLAHVGVIKVLERENIPIDMVAGSSMGALVGAFWASGMNSAEMENVMMGYNQNKLKVFNLLFDICFPKLSLAKGRNVVKFLKKHLGNKTFYDVKLPLKIVSCNLDKRERAVFDTDRLVDAVACSIAIPGVFPPVRSGSGLLIDGGIIDPVPVEPLIKSGIKKIIAVNVLPSPEQSQDGYEKYRYALEKEKIDIQKYSFLRKGIYKLRIAARKAFFPNILDIMVNSLQIMEYMVAREECQKADIVINPVINTASWFEFFKVEELIKKGEFETEKHIAKIKELVNI